MVSLVIRVICNSLNQRIISVGLGIGFRHSNKVIFIEPRQNYAISSISLHTRTNTGDGLFMAYHIPQHQLIKFNLALSKMLTQPTGLPMAKIG